MFCVLCDCRSIDTCDIILNNTDKVEMNWAKVAFVLGLLLRGSLAASCKPQSEPVFGCDDNSDNLVIEYPNDIGVMECGEIFAISEPQDTPSLTVNGLPDDASLYTLLLVDTQNEILHYGAVNVDYDFLTSGVPDNIDQASNVFSEYRGPEPPKFLIIIPGVYQTLFDYEWVLARQVGGSRDVPDLDSNVSFDYEAFLEDTDIVYTSYFSSGFCAKR